MEMAPEAFNWSQTRRLIPIFLVWKALLIFLSVLSPGPGYDTSSLILLGDDSRQGSQSQPFSLLDRVTLSHLRWDALYFVTAAQRGYIYEQEWAFSRTYSLVLATAKEYVFGSSEDSLEYYVWVGVIISNLFHLISVLILYSLARLVLGPRQSPKVPFIASVLHIVSPAGIFLSTPYAESLFSALNFAGMLLYVLARQTGRPPGKWTVTQDAYMLSSGLFFACATLVRGNGLLSGLIFLYDAICFVPRIVVFQLDTHDARRLFVTCVAGGILACGFITPQYLAYQEYCTTGSDCAGARPWCDKWIPSIYSWVQSHYWNVGFLRYWRLPNLPLFLMAAPMLWLLATTSVTVLQHTLHRSAPGMQVRTPGALGTVAAPLESFDFPQLVIPQLVLTVAAATNFHVQIINRISSGYPLWYVIIAAWLVDGQATAAGGKEATYAHWTIRGMTIYAIAQAALFAGFLPPA